MLDIKLIRENPEIIKKDLEKRNAQEKLSWLDDCIKKDKEYRKLLQEAQELRAKRNKVAEEINQLKKQGKDPKKALADAKLIPQKIAEIESKTNMLKEEITSYQMRLPNILHESVPVGNDDSDNVEIKRWGKPPVFHFPAKNHQELAESLGLADFERAAKVSGAGFYYLKGNLAKLDHALQRFAIDHLTGKGYTLVEPPLMLKRKPYEGVTDLSDFESVMYKVENDDLYLIATAEHPMAAMFMDEVFEKKDLPVRLVGISPCFRREIGAHGKYTKGLFRVHNFHKVEQFIFCHPNESWKFHEELQRNSEELYEKLGLHYRVVNICTGDIGSIAAKKYDIEVYMADGVFRESGSNSNCTDYQARRLNVRFREKEGTAVVGPVHTLNNTALATSRTMIAVLEQYQRKDGSVEIPEALVPYMNGLKRL